ncbi:MAG TPA: hypothetical protein VFU85_06160, partial [Nocardioides sp.]|nr:hypothetical protein [Nocardioides sp.]
MRRNDLVAGIYIGALVALAALVTAVSMKDVLESHHDEKFLAWAGMAVLTLLLGRLAVRLPLRQFRISMSDIFLFATAAIFGPALATLNGALDGYAASAHARGAWYKRLFNTASMALSMNLSSWLFVKTSPANGLPVLHSALDYMFPLVLMAGAQYLLN